MRKFVAMAVVMVACLSVAFAEDFTGTIKKVDGEKVTVTKTKKGQPGDDVVVTVTKDTKVTKGAFNKDTKKVEAGEAIEGDARKEALKEKANIRVSTDDSGKATSIMILGGKKKAAQ